MIILASASPRRKRLLKKIVERFSIVPTAVAEKFHAGESFRSASIRLAEAKASRIADGYPDAVVIGADTIAYMGKKAYRSTNGKAKARRILKQLSGRTHYVVTGVAVLFPEGLIVKYAVRAAVKMKIIDNKLLEWYLESGEWKGRAGSYDVSGKGKRLVESIKGERNTVVGLPLERLQKVLKNRLTT